MPAKLTLSQKIAAITNACGEIARKGVGNSTDPNKPLYPYVKIEDVLAVVNPLLKRYKLILTGQVAKEPLTHVGKTWTTSEVLVDWTLEDVEPWFGEERMLQPGDRINIREQRTWRVPGCGADGEGKGVYKAITGSRKYAMVLIFNLKFGDEPEEVQRASQPEPAAKPVE